MVGRWQRWRPHLLALAFYTLLTAFFAWPVLTNLTVGTPGHFPVDRNQNLWNFWWFKRSLFNLDNPYQTGFLFYPYGASLYLHTYSPYNLITGLPLHLLLGLVPAYGLIELLTFPLGGLGGYLLAWSLTGNRWGALLAGLVWSFGPYHFVELRQDQLNLLSLQWLPFFILFMFRLEKARARPEIIKNGLAAAFFFFLTLMVDYYYAVYLAMFAGLYWLWQAGTLLWRNRAGPARAGREIGGLTLKLAGAFIGGALPFTPILLGTLREIGSGKYEALDNISGDQVHSADLATFLLPPAHQPWWGDSLGLWKSLGLHTGPNGEALNNWGAVTGYLAVILAVYALVKLRGLWFWAFNAAFWLVISFGPSLRINGANTGLPLPYRLLVKLPFVGIGRFPERFMLMAQLSAGILAAYGLAHLLGRFGQRRVLGRLPAGVALGGLACALFFVESWPGILPPPDPIVAPAFTAAIAANKSGSSVPAGEAILELPVTTHGNPDSPRMLYQIYHGRPITGGYISRKLIDPQREANDYPLYDWLDLRPPAGPDIIPAKTPREMLGLLNFAGMGYVVLYPGDFEAKGRQEQAQRLVDYTFNAPPYFQDSTARAWLVPPTPLDKPVMVLGKGWTNEAEKVDAQRVQRWIAPGAAEARLMIVAGPGVALKDSYTLTIQVATPDKPRRLQICLNNTLVRDQRVEGVQEIRLDGLKLQPGTNVLDLRPDPADGVFIPSQSIPNSKDGRALRLGFLSFKLD